MAGGGQRGPVFGSTGSPPGFREFLGWLGGGLLFAVVVTWPLLLHLPDRVPQDLGDPLGQAWAMAWGGHALLNDPASLFQANAFWPTGPSLAYSDSLLGYAPLGSVGEGVTAAVVRYNVAFLFAYALAFAGAAMLARELGCSRAAAVVAGVAFALAPWRAAHNGHLNVLTSGGIPLAFALLAGGYRRQRPGRILAGWLVATWQMTIGFALGIYFFYSLVALSLAVAGAWLWRGRPRLDPRCVAATAAGGLVFAATVGAIVLPYLRVLDSYPEAHRDRITVEFYSPPVSSLLVAPPENRMWGERTAERRSGMPWPPEQALFPGITVLVLAGAGAVSAAATRGLRLTLAGVAVVTCLLSFGLRLAGGRWTYGLLYESLPGLEGLRTPGRLTVLTTLALAVLAGLGADRLVRFVAAPRPGGRYRQPPALTTATLRRVAAAGAALLVAAEGLAVLPLHEVPRPPSLGTAAEPQFHLPAGPFEDTQYMLWSVAGFPRIANGYSGVMPERLDRLRDAVRSFPDAASVQVLRDTGFRLVVLHLTKAPGTAWADTAGKPVDGLGITRVDRGDVVVYDLAPGTALQE